MSGRIQKSDLFATLPPPWPHDLLASIRQAQAASRRKLVVLDDDPTGAQTVYGVPVLTQWDCGALKAEFQNDLPCFYILTNSRSLSCEAACALNREIARDLRSAADKGFTIVSRSDSTLRGHFPGETEALAQVLGRFDATFVIPYFEAGGRYTIDDVHYVAEGDDLVPAAETPFAADVAFGYRHSNLREWIEEKTAGQVKAVDVFSISLDDLRMRGPDAVTAKILGAVSGAMAIVNAAAPRDLEVFVSGLLSAEAQGRRYLFRTAASFVAARLGLAPRALWAPPVSDSGADVSHCGGLMIVGSHVPQTTSQLNELLTVEDVRAIEVSVESLLSPAHRQEEITRVIAQMNSLLSQGLDVVVHTSRALCAGIGAADSLRIARRVSDALVEVAHGLVSRPRFLVAKGGITASDVATSGLGVRRAMVLGQILPGVPVWRLGEETRFPGMPYVVFPGNVGGQDALVRAHSILTGRPDQ